MFGGIHEFLERRAPIGGLAPRVWDVVSSGSVSDTVATGGRMRGVPSVVVLLGIVGCSGGDTVGVPVAAAGYPNTFVDFDAPDLAVVPQP